jgi:UDP-glucose 4-epimerase
MAGTAERPMTPLDDSTGAQPEESAQGDGFPAKGTWGSPFTPAAVAFQSKLRVNGDTDPPRRPAVGGGRLDQAVMDVCLITGGAGFIGSHLVKALLASKRVVRVLDNLSTGSLANLGRCAGHVEMVVADLEDLDVVREMVEGVDVVFHLAAAPPEDTAFHLSGFPWQCDVGTAHVLLASRDAGVRRVVYASSTQVYGRGPTSPRTETDLLAPASSFAIAKLSDEQTCSAFTLQCGLETVRLRYSNVFGPRQSPSSPQARFVFEALTALLAGEKPVLEGNALEPLDLIFVEDVVQAALAAAVTPGISGRVYNIAQGQMTNASTVVNLLNDLLGTRLNCLPTGRPLEEELQNRVDISRAGIELGFSPTVDLRNGLLRCLRSFSARMAMRTRQDVQRLTEA